MLGVDVWCISVQAQPLVDDESTEEAASEASGDDENEVEGEGEAAPVVEPEPRDTLDASRALLMAERESILNPGVHLIIMSYPFLIGLGVT